MKEDMKKKPFNFRAFKTLVIFWSLIIDAVSGLVLYTVPSGRIADWTHWTFAGLTKGEWETIHTVFGYIFLIFISLHIYSNRHPLLHYLRSKFRKYTKAKIELFVSLLLVILLLGGTIASIPPFSSLMDLGSLIKDTWPDNKDEPFLARAEKLPFDRFARELGLETEKAVAFLETKGINIKDPGQSLKDNADRNKTSPSMIYILLKEIIPPEKQLPVPRLLHK